MSAYREGKTTVFVVLQKVNNIQRNPNIEIKVSRERERERERQREIAVQ